MVVAPAASQPQHPALRALIDAHPEPHQLFIVLGSPVTEVGRDHDYDWAAVEPSSMRSLIQLAGRIRRHRPGGVDGCNMTVLDSNLRHYDKPNQPAYCKPGFETDYSPFQLKRHEMRDLLSRELRGEQMWAVDARPRVALSPGKLFPSHSLVDLEHARMHDAMLPKPKDVDSALPAISVLRAASLHWAHPDHLWLTGLLPQYQRFRYDKLPREDLVLLPDEDENALRLHRVDDGAQRGKQLYVPVHDSLCHEIPQGLLESPSVSPWPSVSLMGELIALAEAQDLSLWQCAKRYATVSLPASREGWQWSERLGFTKKK